MDWLMACVLVKSSWRLLIWKKCLDSWRSQLVPKLSIEEKLTGFTFFSLSAKFCPPLFSEIESILVDTAESLVSILSSCPGSSRAALAPSSVAASVKLLNSLSLRRFCENKKSHGHFWLIHQIHENQTGNGTDILKSSSFSKYSWTSSDLATYSDSTITQS